MESNHQATHFLFYTCNDLCFYFREVDKWIIHPNVTDVLIIIIILDI